MNKCDNIPPAEYVFSRHNDFSSVRENLGPVFLDLENVRWTFFRYDNLLTSMVADEHSRLRLSGEMAKFWHFFFVLNLSFAVS